MTDLVAEGTGMLESLWLRLTMWTVRLISWAAPPSIAFIAIIADRQSRETHFCARMDEDELASIIDKLLDDEGDGLDDKP